MNGVAFKLGRLRLNYLIAVIAWVVVSVSAHGAPVYYVSPDGNDNNDGLSTDSPWATVAKVNETLYDPGTQILFERGGEWRERLVASSSGAEGMPIVYGAYGEGTRPTFYGSDILPNANFEHLAGTTSTYRASGYDAIHSVFINQEWMRSSTRISGTTDVQANIDFVNTTPNTWYHDGTDLYINTSGSNPNTDGNQYTGVTRGTGVLSFEQSHLVFQDLIADETAQFSAGYGFQFSRGENIKILNSDSYRAGKHSFGALDVDDFLGENLYAENLMPDQGLGGATGYVSYACCESNGATPVANTWRNATFDNPNGDYPAIIVHGDSVEMLRLENFSAINSGISIKAQSTGQRVEIIGGTLHNDRLRLEGNNTLVDGLTITGNDGHIRIDGNQNTIQNVKLLNVKPTNNLKGAIVDIGQDNDFLFNQIILHPETTANNAVFVSTQFSSNSDFLGNIIFNQSANAWLLRYDPGGVFRADYNLYHTDGAYFKFNTVSKLDFDQWYNFGPDEHSISAMLELIDGELYLDGVLASTLIDTDTVLQIISENYTGLPWPIGTRTDVNLEDLGWPLPGDANLDGYVNLVDLGALATHFGMNGVLPSQGDFNLDGTVDLVDLAILAERFGQVWSAGLNSGQGGAAGETLLMAASTSIPEPTSGLLLLSLIAALTRTRRTHNSVR